MKKTLLTLLLLTATILPAAAYDFSAVAPSGQTLYYNIVDGNAQVTYEKEYGARYNNLVGFLIIPESVIHNDSVYSVKSIGNYAFFDCDDLTSITIPNTITYIGRSFSGCDGLTSITIPSSVAFIYTNAFECCSNLSSIVVDNGNSVYDSRNNCNAIIETSTNTLISGCMNTIIPSSITAIGRNAFYAQTHLTTITIPSSVTAIGECAFMNCSGLSSMSVESENNMYDSRNNCNAIIETSTNTIIFGCMNTVIPNTVTAIGNHAFNGHRNLLSVAIPNSVTSIGADAFYNCSSLSSVTIPNTTTSIGNGAFYGCRALLSVTLGFSIDHIGNFAFEYCTSITEIHMKSLNPPTIDTRTFKDIPETCVFYIPCNRITHYSEAEYWSELQSHFIEDCGNISNFYTNRVKVYPHGKKIIIDGCEGEDALVYDLIGRIIHHGRIEGPIHVNDKGVYMVKIGERQPQKVVVR